MRGHMLPLRHQCWQNRNVVVTINKQVEVIEVCRGVSCCLRIVGQNVLPQVKIQAVVESRNLNVGGVKVFLLFKRSVVPRLNECVYLFVPE